MIKNCQVCLAWNYTIEKSVQWRWMSTKLSSLRILLSFKMQRATTWLHWSVLLDIVLQFEAFLQNFCSFHKTIFSQLIFVICDKTMYLVKASFFGQKLAISTIVWRRRSAGCTIYHILYFSPTHCDLVMFLIVLLTMQFAVSHLKVSTLFANWFRYLFALFSILLHGQAIKGK